MITKQINMMVQALSMMMGNQMLYFNNIPHIWKVSECESETDGGRKSMHGFTTGNSCPFPGPDKVCSNEVGTEFVGAGAAADGGCDEGKRMVEQICEGSVRPT